MNVVLLRVGIDTGCGGIHSPLFGDGTFEFVPIPDSKGLDPRTYGNSHGRKGRAFIEYFPKSRREQMTSQAMHVDPEFESFTYGDPTPPKRNLSQLEPGDLLVFYAGMEGWGHELPPALYLAGYFKVELAGFAPEFSQEQLQRELGDNYHVRHPTVFAEQRERLVLIKGGHGSRLFQKAHILGETIGRSNGSYWQMITPQMEKVFGTFGGIGSLQRSTPRWVEEPLVSGAEAFVESLD
jgi:Nucleotide modification associated domain 3